jgi:hypothetical protein
VAIDVTGCAGAHDPRRAPPTRVSQRVVNCETSCRVVAVGGFSRGAGCAPRARRARPTLGRALTGGDHDDAVGRSRPRLHSQDSSLAACRGLRDLLSRGRRERFSQGAGCAPRARRDATHIGSRSHRRVVTRQGRRKPRDVVSRGAPWAAKPGRRLRAAGSAGRDPHWIALSPQSSERQGHRTPRDLLSRGRRERLSPGRRAARRSFGGGATHVGSRSHRRAVTRQGHRKPRDVVSCGRGRLSQGAGCAPRARRGATHVGSRSHRRAVTRQGHRKPRDVVSRGRRERLSPGRRLRAAGSAGRDPRWVALSPVGSRRGCRPRSTSSPFAKLESRGVPWTARRRVVRPP